MAPRSVVFCPNFQCVRFDKPAVFRKLPPPVPPRKARRVEAAKAQVISHYGYARHRSCCLALLTYEKTGGMTKGRERGRLKEAQRGGVELFQAACKLPLFDHYIIASHAAPAVHS